MLNFDQLQWIVVADTMICDQQKQIAVSYLKEIQAVPTSPYLVLNEYEIFIKAE
jgi:hypothetical protein